jgi:O-acetyl-ADP-ribose deacetylase (regulator of RNase III)
MISFTTGNLLNERSEALVNTVNTVGVMGKGIALMFKDAFPDAFEEYAEACERREVQIGKMHVVDRGGFLNPRYIIKDRVDQRWTRQSASSHCGPWYSVYCPSSAWSWQWQTELD